MVNKYSTVSSNTTSASSMVTAETGWYISILLFRCTIEFVLQIDFGLSTFPFCCQAKFLPCLTLLDELCYPSQLEQCQSIMAQLKHLTIHGNDRFKNKQIKRQNKNRIVYKLSSVVVSFMAGSNVSLYCKQSAHVSIL